MNFRRIIIPKGTLITDQTTIIRVPCDLENDAVVVRPNYSYFDPEPLEYISEGSTAFNKRKTLGEKYIEDPQAISTNFVTGRELHPKFPKTRKYQNSLYTSSDDDGLIPWSATPLAKAFPNFLVEENCDYQESILNMTMYSSKNNDDTLYYDTKSNSFGKCTANSSGYKPENTTGKSNLKVKFIKPPNIMQKQSDAGYSSDLYIETMPVNEEFDGLKPLASKGTYNKNSGKCSNSQYDKGKELHDLYIPNKQNNAATQIGYNVQRKDFSQMFSIDEDVEMTPKNSNLSCIYEEDVGKLTKDNVDKIYEDKNKKRYENVDKRGDVKTTYSINRSYQSAKGPMRDQSFNMNPTKERKKLNAMHPDRGF